MVWSRARADETHASDAILLCFPSPRHAVRIMYGLRGVAPGSTLEFVTTPLSGAEGDIVVATGRIAAEDMDAFGRALEALELSPIWGDLERDRPELDRPELDRGSTDPDAAPGRGGDGR